MFWDHTYPSIRRNHDPQGFPLTPPPPLPALVATSFDRPTPRAIDGASDPVHPACIPLLFPGRSPQYASPAVHRSMTDAMGGDRKHWGATENDRISTEATCRHERGALRVSHNECDGRGSLGRPDAISNSTMATRGDRVPNAVNIRRFSGHVRQFFGQLTAHRCALASTTSARSHRQHRWRRRTTTCVPEHPDYTAFASLSATI